MKPFGFLQHVQRSAGLRQKGDAGRTRCNLVASYGERRWWVNLHDPEAAPSRVVSYQSSSGDPSILVGRSYADLIAVHPFHPEAKSLGPDGMPCHQATTGLLHRRPGVATEIVVIGKEANELELVESCLIDELDEVQTIYRQNCSKEIRVQLRKMSIKDAMAFTGLSRRQILYRRTDHLRIRGV